MGHAVSMVRFALVKPYTVLTVYHKIAVKPCVFAMAFAQKYLAPNVYVTTATGQQRTATKPIHEIQCGTIPSFPRWFLGG